MTRPERADAPKVDAELSQAFAVLIKHLGPGPQPGQGAPEPWLTVAEAAAHAQVQEATIRQWIASGLRAGRVGRVLRLRREDIDRWLLTGGQDARTETPPPPAGPRRAALDIVKSL